MQIKKTEKVSLKNHPKINEAMIQKLIFDDPSVLRLGNLTPLTREVIQPHGGRLDILLKDDNNTRYEVEVQLGPTDPSHIIRTIEYWDSERKARPSFDHCAVIVAEEITTRFMNVISLFNGSIPLIALQINAYKDGDDIRIDFVKILDRVTADDDEEDENLVTDRKYWETVKSTPKIMKDVDSIFKDISEYAPGFELKYNKFYVGVTREGLAKNFVAFEAKKTFLYIRVRCDYDETLVKMAEDNGLDISYVSRFNLYYIKIKDYHEYVQHKDAIDTIIKKGKEHFNF